MTRSYHACVLAGLAGLVATRLCVGAEEVRMQGADFEIEVSTELTGPVELKDGSYLAVSRSLWSERSTDGGRTWVRSNRLLDKDGNRIAGVDNGLLRPRELVRLQSGAIALGYWESKAKDTRETGRQRYFFSKSLDEGQTWSTPVLVSFPRSASYPMWMIQTAAGRLVLANEYYYGNKTLDRGMGVCNAYYSDDEGKSWSESYDTIFAWEQDGAMVGSAQVPCVVETPDGRILMFARTYLGRIVQSYSEDGGEHWGVPRLNSLVSNSSEVFLTRLPTTGDLLCVFNQASAEEVRQGYYRSRLTSAVSKDSGKTWEHFRTIAMSPGQKQLSRIIDAAPPAYVRSPGIPTRENMLPEGFEMNLGPRVRFAGNKAFLVFQKRLYRYPEGRAKWERVYSKHILRVTPIEWFYSSDPKAAGAFRQQLPDRAKANYAENQNGSHSIVVFAENYPDAVL